MEGSSRVLHLTVGAVLGLRAFSEAQTPITHHIPWAWRLMTKATFSQRRHTVPQRIKVIFNLKADPEGLGATYWVSKEKPLVINLLKRNRYIINFVFIFLKKQSILPLMPR